MLKAILPEFFYGRLLPITQRLDILILRMNNRSNLVKG